MSSIYVRGMDLKLSPKQTISDVEGNLKLLQLVEIPPYRYGAIFQRQ